MYYIELELGCDSHIDTHNPVFEFDNYEEMKPFIRFYLDQGYTISIGEVGDK